ncbi:LAMI_0E04742g1_1 [Lachancea mirantina]|uniref:LAMI_0E04742g1_1 n=1 Tax=Lachancea mirantina TaxID=1230905 RepID=A0A1G4JKL2_9SACH|nr:LAMI_0E04742g1_1 [Lachancea mirantina]
MFELHVLKRPERSWTSRSKPDSIDPLGGNAASSSVQDQIQRNTGFELNDKRNHNLSTIQTAHEVSREMDPVLSPGSIELEDLELPEGGLKAWLVVFGSFMGLIPLFGMINSLGAIQSYISKHQLATVSSSSTSWIFSLYLSITFLSCIFTGGYFDRNGGRRPLIVGTVMYTGGVFATGNCTTLWQFILAFSVLGGLASGILMTPLVSCIATWFIRKRGTATSIATIGGSLGGVIFPVMLRKLYSEVGFQWALRIVALLCLFMLVCSIVFAVERETASAVPFESKREGLKFYMTSAFNWSYFSDAKYMFAVMGMALAESSLTASATFFASYAMAQKNSESISYALLAATNAIGVPGRFVSGYVADKWIGRFNTIIITLTITTIFNLVLWLPFGSNINVLWAYTILYGFSTGSILSLSPVCLGQISKTSDFGKRYATGYMIEALVILPMIPIGGAIIGQGSIKSYNNFIIFTSILMIASAGCYVISRFFCVGNSFCKF